MSKIIDAVSIVLTCGNEVFAIQRQNYLKAFPGYWAFPGGKVEKEDEAFISDHHLLKGLDHRLFGALVREGREELGVDFHEAIKNGVVDEVHYLGLAVTPDFNPYRFATYFFRINFKEKIPFIIDENEAQRAVWTSSADLLNMYDTGHLLAVPPVIKVIETLGKNPRVQKIDDLNFQYDSSKFVPCIESLKSVRQIMPLSHTLPPATRTNAFLIGDGHGPKLLIDPSPLSDAEYLKFKNTVELFGVDKIMLTHHHPDHHERSTDLAREYEVPMLMSDYTHQALLKMDSRYFDGIDIVLIKEGDVVTEWLGRKVQVHAIPGHDEGQLAVAPHDMSWFLAGDLFQGVGTVVIGGEEGDMKKYFQTLERIITMAPKVVFPSHGIGLGGTSILERTLEHRKVRENQVLVMHGEGKTPEQMLEIIYAETPKVLWPFAMKNIEKHLVKLKEEGII